MTSHFDRATAMAHRVAAFLLAYPDDELRATLPTLHAAASDLPGTTGAPLLSLVDWLHRTPLIEAQQHYVETFDMRRRCSLYLTFWTAGDTRNRGTAILEFTAAYRRAGLAPPEEELPDHLAVVLEFAATADQRVGTALLLQHHAGLTLLEKALDEQPTTYAKAVEAVLSTLPAPTETTLRAAARTAATGPPQESVGLDDLPFERASSTDRSGARR